MKVSEEKQQEQSAFNHYRYHYIFKHANHSDHWQIKKY